MGCIVVLHSDSGTGVGVQETLSAEVIFADSLRLSYLTGLSLKDQRTFHYFDCLLRSLFREDFLHVVLDL